MYRRFRNVTRDKILNTAAVAPVMPARRKRTPAPLPAVSDNSFETSYVGYGIPPLALKLIAANYLFWIVAFALLLSRVLPALHFVVMLFLMIVGLGLLLVLQWLISRAFWWFVVAYSSLITVALIVAFVSRVMDAMEKIPTAPVPR